MAVRGADIQPIIGINSLILLYKFLPKVQLTLYMIFFLAAVTYSPKTLVLYCC